MARWQLVPYVNFQDQNLDWIMDEVKKIDNFVHTTLESIIGEEAKKFFESYAFDYLYVEETETIKFVGKVSDENG